MPKAAFLHREPADVATRCVSNCVSFEIIAVGIAGSRLGHELHSDRQYLMSCERGRTLRTLLLVSDTALAVGALRVALRAVHLAVACVLLRTVDLLLLRVVGWSLPSGGLIANRGKLRTATHLRRHHVLLVLAWLTLRLRGVGA